MAKQRVIMGTELKLNIAIEPMGEIHASSYDFNVDFYCSARKIKAISKAELLPIDDDNFIARFDTNEVGTGELKCRITAYIPDEDFTDDGLRTEVIEIVTNYDIVKSL